jgi:hypothetical protein
MNQPEDNKTKPAAPDKSLSKKLVGITSQKLNWLLLGGLVLFIIVFLITTTEGLAFLGKKSQSMVNLKVQSQSGDEQLVNLQRSKEQVKKYAYFKDIAKTVIPNDKDQAEAVVQIYQFANQAGIALKSITFPTSTLGLSATTVTTQGAADSTSVTKAALSQAKPVSGVPGLYSLSLIVTSDGSSTLPPALMTTYPKMQSFLQQIENNRRTAQITDFNVIAADKSPMYFSLDLNIFIKP